MHIPETSKNEIRRLLAQKKKLEAVKLARASLDLSLRDAVRLVDALEADEPVQLNTFSRTGFPRRAAHKGDKTFVLLYRIFLAIGVLLAAIAAGLAYDTEALIRSSSRVEGTVIGFADYTEYAPLVEFTSNGETRRLKGSVSSNPPVYEIGETVGVFIPSDTSASPLIDSITELWMGPIILICIGFFFLFFGLVMYALRPKSF